MSDTTNRSPEYDVVLSTMIEAFDVAVVLRGRQKAVHPHLVPMETVLAIYDRFVALRGGDLPGGARPGGVIVLPTEEVDAD